MLAIQRRGEILSILEHEKSVLVSELSRLFDVSEETVRRDLEKLESDGLIKRTYGGAVLHDSIAAEPSYRLREMTNKPQKQRIAEKIVPLIDDNSHIMLDASSTAVMVANKLRDKKGLTIITNSVEILLNYSNCKETHVISTGGTLRESSLSLVGRNAEHMLRDFTVDKAIISCKGVDFEKGFTESNEAEMEVKRAMIRCAKEIILAVDSSKFGRRSFVRIMDIAEAHYIVTDDPSDKDRKGSLSDEWLVFLAERGVKLL